MVWILFAALVACDAEPGAVVLGEGMPNGLRLQEVAYSCPELEAGVRIDGLDASIWIVEACGEALDGVWECTDIGQYARVRAEAEGTVLTVRCSDAGGWSSFGVRYLAP